MGVPKFYRWISERYPCLSEVVKEYQIPEFDNLYLDMNGIIHVCSHPNDEDVVSRIPEEKIFADIFHYLEVLFRMIRPRKLFFMAVDGVAPRAKMNQQRGRRFKSAREAENREKEARAKGVEIPTEERFDSNCITPGTPFMARLQEQLNCFVVNKISTDPLWQGVKVILSGHQTPGEGEHKIMEYIRWSRSLPDHDPHTRHCLYGLDADLIMLGLCTHEPHFALLREEVKFGGNRKKNAVASRPSAPEHTTFHLLHLSLMREYLEYEFSSVKDKISFPYDLESIIDDWVLMGFLVGNDFIPHLPNLHIHQGALPLLYEAYKAVLPKLDGYINEGGKLNLPRFQIFLEQLSSMDLENFSDSQADLKWLEGRKGGNGYKPAQARARDVRLESSEKAKNKELAAYLDTKNAEIEELLRGAASEDDGDDSDSYETVDEEDSNDDEKEEESEENLLVQEFKTHKVNYYKEKLEYAEVTEEVLRSQAEGYVRAIQWNLYYYYEGVASWSWYYPHHYAPFISDIQNFKNLKLEFELGRPFLPFQQLLGVLPPASKKLLPSAYAELMTSSLSPIYDYYPVNFLTDLNGKQQDWEALVLIPFIDEVRLLEAMKSCDEQLPEEDRRRNKHGPMQIYMYTPEDLGAYKGRGVFGSIVHNHAQLTELPRETFLLSSPSKLVKGLHPKMDLNLFVPGFPTLRHIPHKHFLTEARVVVFQMPARGASMILEILPKTQEEIREIAKQLLGKVVHVDWPHLVEGRVVGVASPQMRFDLDKNTGSIVESEEDQRKWGMLEDGFRDRYATRWGIQIGHTPMLVYVTPLQGRQYVVTQAGRVTLDKQWSPVIAPYPLQATVQDIKVLEPLSSICQYESLEDLFPPNSVCFMLGHPHYGSMARVVKASSHQKTQIKILCHVRSEPDLRAIYRAHKGSSYMPGYMAATRVGISSHLLSRITGNVFIISSSGKKVGVGLNLKLNKKNQEVPGYSKRIEGQWQYSKKCIEILNNYCAKFPELFDSLSGNASNDIYNAKEIFGDKEEEVLPALDAYVSQLECQHADRATCGGVGLETDVIKLMEEEVDRQKENLKEKVANMGVKPHLLYKPHLHSGSAIPDPSTTYLIMDRVIYVKEGSSVPVGLKGTIIGIVEAAKPMDSVYEVLFDEEFPAAISIKGSGLRAFRLSSATLINISHGYRNVNTFPPIAFAKPPPMQTASYSAKTKEQPQAPVPSKPPTRAPASSAGTRKSASLLMAERARSSTTSIQQSVETVATPPSAEGLKSLLNIGQESQNQKKTLNQVSEFEAIWLNLKKQKAQAPTLQEAARSLPSAVPAPTPKAIAAPPALVDDCSRELGKLLNIIGNGSARIESPDKPTPPVASVTGRPLSLQELFQSASLQPQGALGPPLMVPPPPNPTRELMMKCQERSWGVPMYTYLETLNGVVAKIDLPIGGSITGPPALDRNVAAEAAASQALTHFGLRGNPLTIPLPMPIPHQFNHRFPMPPFPLTRPATSFVPLQVQAGRQSGSAKHNAAPAQNVFATPPPVPAPAALSQPSRHQQNGNTNHKNGQANEKNTRPQVGQNQGRPPGKPRLAARFDMAKF